jgi:hypothetical protein
MRLPVSWVTDALDALQSLGYVVAGKQLQGSATSGAPQVTDPYFPTAPATNLMVTKVTADLSSPMEHWVENWHFDMPINLRKAIHLIGRDHGEATMSDILQAL